MASLTSACAVGKEKVTIDPHTLFHRLIIAGERKEQLRDCFAFELTQYPLSLFKDGRMRKPDKPSLYRDFASGMMSAELPQLVQYRIYSRISRSAYKSTP